MNIVVSDSCTLLKWVLDETEGKKQALQLQDDYRQKKVRILLPIFWLAEIGNTLGLKRKDKANEYFSYFLLWHFTEVPISLSLASLAFEIMAEFSKTAFYDAAYHALALQEGGLFLTADRKYYEKTKTKSGIMYLGDYGK